MVQHDRAVAAKPLGLEAGELFAAADDLLLAGTGVPGSKVSTQLMTGPWLATSAMRDEARARVLVFEEFFRSCLEVFRDALDGNLPRAVYKFLLNDAPGPLRRRYHQHLPSSVFARPMFFRTDECVNGLVVEIQCPGSGWGDLLFYPDLYRAIGYDLEWGDTRGQLIADLLDAAPQAERGVLHLLDNASVPWSMSYLIRATSPPLLHWGYSPGVRNRDCGLVRSHSVMGLVAENLFTARLKLAADGKVQFDLPPLVLFDQKAPLALPFWDLTRNYFSDEVRAIIAYSAPVTPAGFQSENGEWINFDTFPSRPKGKRRYYFKYAGFDTAYNWGSRAVYRGSDNGFDKHIERIRSEAAAGHPWIVQPDFSEEADVSYVERGTDEVVFAKNYVKLSRFYGPKSCFGTKIMSSGRATVHGQSDTAVGLVF